MIYVLCLDDDFTIANMLADVVTFCGYHPIVETSPLRAITTWLRDARLHVVLTDYMMPELNGLEVLSIFYESRPRDVRRVLITAAPHENEVRAATTEGVVQMLIAKPPSIFDIRAALAWLYD